MSSPELDNLVRVGKLKREPPTDGEVEGLFGSGQARLKDASTASLAVESRFDLVYNAAHALALAALRRLGYRSDNRYLVFQVLPHTLGAPSSVWKVLARAHEVRNRAEYEGVAEIDEGLVEDTIQASRAVAEALSERLRE